MSRGYDRIMIALGIGNNRKLRRLPATQRWAYVAGVLTLAGQSPVRGALLIADGEPVTAEDVRDQATVSLKDARATLDSLRRLGMLQRDEHGVEWVHDWEDYNPEPKPSDSPEETRRRKREERARRRAEEDRHANVTRDTGVTSRPSHAPKLSEGKEHPPTPSELGEEFPLKPSGNRARDRERYQAQVEDWITTNLPQAQRYDQHRIQIFAESLRKRRIAPTAEHIAETARFNNLDGFAAQETQAA